MLAWFLLTGSWFGILSFTSLAGLPVSAANNLT
jgi:hypothetical protein